MAYATDQDLIDRFGEAELLDLADRDGDGVVDAEVTAGALGDASELVDSYIGKRYDLPLASAPAVLKRIAADIARYFLFKDEAIEAAAEAYRDALKFLRDVADGKAELNVAGDEPAAAPAKIEISAPVPVFSRETLEGF